MRQSDRSFAVGLVTGSLAALVMVMPQRSSARNRGPYEDQKNNVASSPAERAAGADAESPSQIPVKGWWNVLKRALAGFSSDRVMANAAAVTFYVLLALFPAIAALISIYGLFADPHLVESQVDSLSGLIPGGGLDILKSEVHALTDHGQEALGWGVALGLVTSVWSANAGVKAVFDALNVVYHEEEKRSFIGLTLTSLAFTVGLVAFAILAILMIVGAPILLNVVGLGWTADLIVRFARWPVLIACVGFVLAFLYRFGPSRNRARWRWVTWGSGFAALFWIGASALFSFYVANFGSYNKTYGSLGAVIGFMTWIWISSIIVLFGAEINAELEQQTERDSTVGPEKPAGRRGAYKADVKS